MSEAVSVPMGRHHSESVWRCGFSSPSKITNTSRWDGSRTKICVADIRAVHIDPAELEFGMAGSSSRDAQMLKLKASTTPG